MSALKDKLDELDERLAEKRAPSIEARNVYSMEPAGLYGSVYVRPSGKRLFYSCAIVGGVIGCIILGIIVMYIVNAMNESTKVSAVVESLSTPVERNFPMLSDMYVQTDDDIYATLSGNNTLYQVSKDEAGMELLRLPSSVTVDQMAAYYAEGFSKMTTDELATVLQGAWWLTTNRGTSLTFKLKYADFTSGSIEMSIRNAKTTQGFDASSCTVLASGEDSSGNTYEYGSMTLEDGTVRYWRVAACPLSDVYNKDGLPAAAFYVGVTLANNAFVDLSTLSTTESSTTESTTIPVTTSVTSADTAAASETAAATDENTDENTEADQTAEDNGDEG